MLLAASTNHVIATTFFLDSNLAIRTRLGCAFDFGGIFLSSLILIASFVVFLTCQVCVPLDTVPKTYLGLTFLARNVQPLSGIVQLAMTTLRLWTPYEICRCFGTRLE